MSNPAAPRVPQPPERTTPEGDAGMPDEPNPFGPDAPNVRDDDPAGEQPIPLASPPSPPETPLDEADFAPDET